MYSTVDEPDGALMVRCGNRREACCPSCAHEYRGDTWQLVYAGLAGGRKGVPEQVAEHPQVFASLTAPSFGAVHNRPDDGRRCRCGQRHDADDPLLGAAINPATYDYEGAVLWNWHAPALWNRFTVELVRVLAAHGGLSERAWRQRVRIAFAKVAEFQARGLVHFHAIVRLDGAEDRATAPGVAVSPEELCDTIREAARRVRLDGDAGDGETIVIPPAAVARQIGHDPTVWDTARPGWLVASIATVGSALGSLLECNARCPRGRLPGRTAPVRPRRPPPSAEPPSTCSPAARAYHPGELP